jgi:DNA-binding transcriptional LysR family regulator
MELRHLRYFVAVAEEQNVTRAARRLHVAQPPLSRQIHDLEDELGVALFERAAASLRLTDSGRKFLSEARAVLRRAAAAVQAVQKKDGSKKTEIQIGYAPAPTAGFLPRILRDYKKAAPEVHVALHELASNEMLSGLRRKRLHAAFLVEHPASLMRGLTFEKLFSYRVGIVAHKKHPLARRRGVAIREILDEALIVLSRKEYPDHHYWLRRLLGVTARKLRSAEESDGTLSLLAAVEAGRGIAVTSESVLSVAGSRVMFVPLKPAPRPLIVGICYHGRTLAASPTRQFVETARRSAAAIHSVNGARR